jgi:hypothetical protein
VNDLSQVIADLRKSTVRLKTKRLKLPLPGDLCRQSSNLFPVFTPLKNLDGEQFIVQRNDILIVIGAEFEKVKREEKDVDTFSVILFSTSLQRLLKTMAFDENERQLFDFWFEVIA